MERSSSQPTKNRQNPSSVADYEDVVFTFGSLGFGKFNSEDVALSFGSFGLRKNNNATSSSSSSNSNGIVSNHGTPEEDAAEGTNSKKIKNQCSLNQETSDEAEWFSKKSASDNTNIWKDNNLFTTAGEHLVSKVQNSEQEMSPMDYSTYLTKLYLDLCDPSEISADGGISSIEQSRTQSSFSGYHPSTYNYFVNQFNGSNPLLYHDKSFRPMGLNNFGETKDNGLCYGNEYHATNNYLTSSRLWGNQQQGSNAFAEAGFQIDETLFEKILKCGDHEQKKLLLSTLHGSISMMMINTQMSFFFQMLVNACEGQLLNSLVGEVLSDRDFFLDAAFCKQGASSIIKLIKKLKKSHHAFTVTKILSTRFFDMMTHYAARIVIQQCLILFRCEANEILYEKAIDLYQDLAMDKVGCRSLNDCISTIAGEQRLRLLNHIADASDYLSNDPYGNYVVQNVLALKNNAITDRILCCLKSQFMQLAQQKGGSHVVEKCMEASNSGLIAVVEEILACPKAAFHLAQDHFGNYVIQKAVKMTKGRGFGGLYNSLVKSLLRYCKPLNRTPGGKSLLNLLKDEVQFQRTEFN